MRTMLALLLVIVATAAAGAQTVAGDWQGTIVAGPAQIRVVIHVAQTRQGGLTATMDSPDQGAKGIPTASVSFAGGTLKFDVPAVAGGYEGKINAAGTAIAGTWSQAGRSTPLELTPAPVVPERKRVVKGSDIDGDWEGTLAGQLRLALHITTFDDGMAATMDSLDQGAMGMPVTTITRSGAALTFSMPAIAGGFAGDVSADVQTISGTWTQAGNSLPLAFKRTKKP